MTRSGPSNTTRSMSASDNSGTIWPGASTVPSASSQTRAKDSWPVRMVINGRGRSPPGGRAGTGRHLDQGVGTALAGGAHRPVALVVAP